MKIIYLILKSKKKFSKGSKKVYPNYIYCIEYKEKILVKKLRLQFVKLIKI